MPSQLAQNCSQAAPRPTDADCLIGCTRSIQPFDSTAHLHVEQLAAQQQRHGSAQAPTPLAGAAFGQYVPGSGRDKQRAGWGKQNVVGRVNIKHWSWWGSTCRFQQRRARRGRQPSLRPLSTLTQFVGIADTATCHLHISKAHRDSSRSTSMSPMRSPRSSMLLLPLPPPPVLPPLVSTAAAAAAPGGFPAAAAAVPAPPPLPPPLLLLL